MPTYESFCRTPLVNPAYVVLPDHAVHMEGTLQTLIQKALDQVDLSTLSPLDAVLATKLGGYTDMPPMPNLAAAAETLTAAPRPFMDALRAGLMIATATRNKNAMLHVLTAVRALTDALPAIGEGALLSIGADALRVASELYRRTGQRFLLTLMERLRIQLPDVSGLFQTFPFQKAFQPERVADDATDETAQYHRRMKQLGTGAVTADALAITAAFALYSGSARDASASKAGVAALQRYHGMPHGAFAADPYLAGRDLSRASDLDAVCAQLEALHDLLAASGEVAYAERMERITVNALATLVREDGVCPAQSVNRLASDETCMANKATPAQVTALLRALHAVRRSVWMVNSEADIAMLLPYEGCCLARMDGTPVRICAARSDPQTITLTMETKQPVEFTLHLYVPGYAVGASVSMNNGKPQAAVCGKLHPIKRMFKTGDTVSLRLQYEPFVESGFRGSASVYYGPYLMALPLPNANAAWQYALDADAPLTCSWTDGRPQVKVDACLAPSWSAGGRQIPPPPQGIAMGDAYELTLLPYAETLGRIAGFPQAVHRA